MVFGFPDARALGLGELMQRLDVWVYSGGEPKLMRGTRRLHDELPGAWSAKTLKPIPRGQGQEGRA
jgi:hypothetical protein